MWVHTNKFIYSILNTLLLQPLYHLQLPPIDISPTYPDPDPDPDPTTSTYTSPALIIPPNLAPYPSTLGPSLWRSTRTNCGTRNDTRYQDALFNSLILDP